MFKTLYPALVRTHLEYLQAVWSLHYKTLVNSTEKVQMNWWIILVWTQGPETTNTGLFVELKDDIHSEDLTLAHFTMERESSSRCGGFSQSTEIDPKANKSLESTERCQHVVVCALRAEAFQAYIMSPFMKSLCTRCIADSCSLHNFVVKTRHKILHSSSLTYLLLLRFTTVTAMFKANCPEALFHFITDAKRRKKEKILCSHWVWQKVELIVALRIVFSLIILHRIDSKDINHCERHGSSGGEKLEEQTRHTFVMEKWKRDTTADLKLGNMNAVAEVWTTPHSSRSLPNPGAKTSPVTLHDSQSHYQRKLNFESQSTDALTDEASMKPTGSSNLDGSVSFGSCCGTVP
ncbi:Hypothetical predicted protein [Scomber scombrus]|uniref:Uncharacterized protein n=1 Tax=Scomber scombrus TaxID=13677 RepID=A0AAV1MVV0_SCOSC